MQTLNSDNLIDQEKVGKAWDFLLSIQKGGARFLIGCDGIGWVQVPGENISIEGIDLSDFVAAMKLGKIAEWCMVDFLVPETLCGKWRLGMQVNNRAMEVDHYAIFLPFKQELPCLPDEWTTQ